MDKFTYDNSQYPKEIPEKISEFLADYMGDNFKYMSYDDNFKDLGFDSLDIIEIVMALESEFHIVIHDEEVDKNLTTVGHLIDFIQGKVDKNPYTHLD